LYHDQSTIFVGFFGQCVQFGDCVVKGLFCQVTCSIGRVQDLVVKDGEVEGEAKTDLKWLVKERERVTGCVGGSSVTATSEAALYASRDLSAESLRLSPKANSAR
jgi:hypothetical protein